MKKHIILLILAFGLASGNFVLAEENQPSDPGVNNLRSASSLSPENIKTTFPCWLSAGQSLGLGSNGDGVKELQSLLSQDKTIYPEGLVTGYFGQLTKEAVKRFQRKAGLSETGEVNEASRPFIYPCFELKVSYPNGGESFKVGETIKISWEAKLPPFAPAKSSLNAALGGSNTASATAVLPKLIKPMLAIDMINVGAADAKCLMSYPERCAPAEKAVFRIQNVAFEDGPGSIVWQIPQSIPESKNYKIRISNSADWSCPRGTICAMNFVPSWKISDVSDGVFAILGGAPEPVSSGTGTGGWPNASSSPELIRMRDEVAGMIKQLQDILGKINGLLGI